MLVWNEHDHDLHEAFPVHQSPVGVIQWSNNGNRLVTADEVLAPVQLSQFLTFYTVL